MKLNNLGEHIIASHKRHLETRLRHVPQRTCIGCRKVKPKGELVRIVCNESGNLTVDPTGKLAGRGCYLCKTKDCWEVALQKECFERALRTKITAKNRDNLARYLETFAS
jgi:predicted RNA-binding protein YlxR (DUF448 family)